jgi:hypothetical protein
LLVPLGGEVGERESLQVVTPPGSSQGLLPVPPDIAYESEFGVTNEFYPGHAVHSLYINIPMRMCTRFSVFTLYLQNITCVHYYVIILSLLKPVNSSVKCFELYNHTCYACRLDIVGWCSIINIIINGSFLCAEWHYRT